MSKTKIKNHKLRHFAEQATYIFYHYGRIRSRFCQGQFIVTIDVTTDTATVSVPVTKQEVMFKIRKSWWQ